VTSAIFDPTTRRWSDVRHHYAPERVTHAIEEDRWMWHGVWDYRNSRWLLAGWICCFDAHPGYIVAHQMTHGTPAGEGTSTRFLLRQPETSNHWVWLLWAYPTLTNWVWNVDYPLSYSLGSVEFALPRLDRYHMVLVYDLTTHTAY
jgi:hypothetical protein